MITTSTAVDLSPAHPISPSPLPLPRTPIAIRVATLADLPFLDALQKQHSKQLGFFPRAQMEEYVGGGHVLVAEEGGNSELGTMNDERGKPVPFSVHRSSSSVQPTPVGYVISRDRYLKRDELGVIFQLCVVPGRQRGLIGATLVREVFARAAYGCRLYGLWCAQDLEANHFWESLGFVPIAFRAGSEKKRRVHIFWQARIRPDDTATPWWFPSQTSGGAIGDDRLVFPIPPGKHWRDEMPMILPRKQLPGVRGQLPVKEEEKPETRNPNQIQNKNSSLTTGHRPPTTAPAVRQFGAPSDEPVQATPPEPAAIVEKPKREKKPKVKCDPRHIAMARELRDRWLEHVNTGQMLIDGAGKYDVTRAIDASPIPKQLPFAA